MIEDDLVDFPIDLDSRYATLEWTVGDVSSGRLTFVLRSSKITLVLALLE